MRRRPARAGSRREPVVHGRLRPPGRGATGRGAVRRRARPRGATGARGRRECEEALLGAHDVAQQGAGASDLVVHECRLRPFGVASRHAESIAGRRRRSPPAGGRRRPAGTPPARAFAPSGRFPKGFVRPRRTSGSCSCRFERERDLIAHPRVRLHRFPSPQRLPRRRCADAPQRPGRVPADQRLLVVQRHGERGNGLGRAPVAERDGDVAEEAAAPGALDGRILETAAELPPASSSSSRSAWPRPAPRARGNPPRSWARQSGSRGRPPGKCTHSAITRSRYDPVTEL